MTGTPPSGVPLFDEPSEPSERSEPPAAATEATSSVALASPSSVVSATPATVWRRARGPVAFVLVGLLVVLVVAALMPRDTGRGLLDPDNPGRPGGRALAEILRDRGTEVVGVRTLDELQDSATADDIVLITSPHYVPDEDWRAYDPGSTSLVIVDPSPAALTALAPWARPAGGAPVQPRQPACALPAATLAGEADLGGQLFDATGEDTALCYASDGDAALVHRAPPGSGTVTVLGTPAPFTNAGLGERGNAALALNLLEGHDRIFWMTPLPPAPGSAGDATLTELLPPAVGLVTLQLLVAVLLLALWRARRLGPLVPERLPVVVRAAETTQGLGRLYRARRARDRAAAALREAWRTRVCPGLGLPADGDPRAVVDEVAERTGRRAADVGAVLYGPDPRDDAALVRLADALDTLEREVRRP